ncbi:phosphodiesterase [Siculibacillus lacustris]|uniref:Phosphodiesterase n=1 Tax=Siculibacillus lacustris TaxID=1549641 RepID=A0A4Q9VQ57_9HYPH|nr:GGDEF domain-containing phosphodiesterase [Siculibacillus lacustris]TBW37650.1 phosphodiesterase [Siculibacillus lacustris]
MSGRTSERTFLGFRLRTPRLYLLFGAAFGGSFVVLGVMISLAERGLPVTALTTEAMFVGNPLLWIIALSPLVQGASFYLVGRSRASLEDELAARRAAEAEMRHRAFHDDLTGLPNRAFLFDVLDGGTACAGVLMMFDLDKFKNVNDTLGHVVGDALLKEIAGELRRVFEWRGWLLHRLGGDEFAMIVPPDTLTPDSEPASEVGALFERPFMVGDAAIQIGVSVGVCRITEDLSSRELLRRADVALYVAKARTGNSWVRFDDEMDAAMRRRSDLERDLARALEAGEFVLHYQPIYDIASERAVGCEALIRWRSPSRGLVTPIEFIDIAEETGLIVDIGRWVLNEACGVAAGWPRSVGVAVNVSPVQFRNWAFLSDLGRALSASGLAAERLTLEITESLLIDDIEETVRMLERIRALGIKVSLDDFGTGYSNLGYLQRIPVDRIKVDASFVRRMLENEADAQIVAAVVRLSRGIGKRVTIEGIERVEQLEHVRALGADEAQGFLFSPGVPADELAALLAPRAGSRPSSA